MNFKKRYINLALMLYEVMAEMFEITKYHQHIYDLELITEMIMRLRAKFNEYGDLRTDIDGHRRNEQNSSTAHSVGGVVVNSKVASLASEYKVQEEREEEHRLMDSPDDRGDVDGFLDTAPSPDDDEEIRYHHQYSNKGRREVEALDLDTVEVRPSRHRLCAASLPQADDISEDDEFLCILHGFAHCLRSECPPRGHRASAASPDRDAVQCPNHSVQRAPTRWR